MPPILSNISIRLGDIIENIPLLVMCGVCIVGFLASLTPDGTPFFIPTFILVQRCPAVAVGAVFLASP